MATGATVHRAELSIADMDRAYYADHSLTVARHPSETVERMMVRLLAFALFADPALQFGRGLSTDDEPDLWQLDDAGQVLRWIDVGLPEERRLRKASSRAAQVVVLAYGGSRAEAWWKRNQAALARLDRLMVLSLPSAASAALGAMAQRSMHLTVTVQDAHVWVGAGDAVADVPVQRLKEAAAG
jgi:uncharacterized protein YaeQ